MLNLKEMSLLNEYWAKKLGLAKIRTRMVPWTLTLWASLIWDFGLQSIL